MELDLHGVVKRAVRQALRLSEPPPSIEGTTRRKTPPIVGKFFAELAESQGLSADSFRSQILELEQLNSPPEFIEHARDAANCEQGHQLKAAELAVSLGQEPEEGTPELREPRELYEFALHNATQGCVRETYEAATRAHQSQRARDEEVRRLLKGLASVQAGHAAFFWDLHHWALSQLSPARGRSIRAAQREAFLDLRSELEEDVSSELVDWVGFARGAAASKLLDSIEGELSPLD